MIDFSDVLIVIGAALVILGVWLIYPPAVVLVVGLFLLVAGLVRAAKQTSRRGA
jgi:uncharacterized membrane protein HdeD (DUF308 family)